MGVKGYSRDPSPSLNSFHQINHQQVTVNRGLELNANSIPPTASSNTTGHYTETCNLRIRSLARMGHLTDGVLFFPEVSGSAVSPRSYDPEH